MQPPHATTGVRYVLVSALLALALALALAVGWQGPASAHTELVASSPAAGATVLPSTDLVVLSFATDLSPVGNAIVVRDSDNHSVASGATRVRGDTLQVPIAPLTPGRHSVAYRFVGLDGHAATGHLWFTVVADGAPTPSAATALGAAVPPSGPRGGVGGSPTAERGTTTGAAASTPTATDGIRWLVALLCLIGGFGLLRRRPSVRDLAPVPASNEEAARPWRDRGS